MKHNFLLLDFNFGLLDCPVNEVYYPFLVEIKSVITFLGYGIETTKNTELFFLYLN